MERNNNETLREQTYARAVNFIGKILGGTAAVIAFAGEKWRKRTIAYGQKIQSADSAAPDSPCVATSPEVHKPGS